MKIGTKKLSADAMAFAASGQWRDALTSGFSLSEALASGFSLRAARASGFSLREARASGFSLSDAMASGFSLSEARASGFSLRDALTSGFSLSEALASGFSLREARASGFSLSEALAEAPVLKNPYSTLLSDIQEMRRTHDQSTFGPEDFQEQNICGTAMCTAGHLVQMAGAEGRALKEKFGFPIAAALIAEKSHPGWPQQNYGIIPQEWAMAFIEKMAAREQLKEKS